MNALSQLAETMVSPTGGFAFCGTGVSGPAGDTFHRATAKGILGDADSYWRAASISKIVTGRVVHDAVQRAGLDTATVQDILGLPFRAPDGTAPTVGQLVSHTAGISDAAGYVVPADVPLPDWLAECNGGFWSGASPGAQFEYSNLGFTILGACGEVASGKPFDALTREYFQSRDIAASFNWTGQATPVHVLPTYRRTDAGQFEAQIDGAGPTVPMAPDPYGLALHHQIYSPQGGMRISLRQLMALGRTLPDPPTGGGWVNDPNRTVGPADLFQSYAWGAQILDNQSFYPRPLVGHFANAYGFCGGLWWDAARDLVFAYALNGLPNGDEGDGLRPQERAIFEMVAQTA